MLSRVADALYWMSRYLERAEHIARVVNVNLNVTLDRAPSDANPKWGQLLTSLPDPPSTAPRPPSASSDATIDLANHESIQACVGAARENARQVREEISSEMWEELNRLYLFLSRVPDSGNWAGGAHGFLTATVSGVQMFQGVTDATMTHAEGWHFMELGRYLERAGATAALLEVQYRDCSWATTAADVSEYAEWVGVLKSCCAFEAYCRHYTADLRPQRIAEFLILNSDFPRSIHFSAGRIQASLKALASLPGHRSNRADRFAGRLLASLDYGQTDEIVADIAPYLQGISRQTQLINAAVQQQYITYAIDSDLAI